MGNEIIIPKVWGHDIQIINEGIGNFSTNSKEYCKCNDCSNLRGRRDKIYKHNNIIYKILRFFR